MTTPKQIPLPAPYQNKPRHLGYTEYKQLFGTRDLQLGDRLVVFRKLPDETFSQNTSSYYALNPDFLKTSPESEETVKSRKVLQGLVWVIDNTQF